MAKRKANKVEFQSKQPRFEDDSDLEQAMHDFADELELWGTSDDEQLMCDAVDEYERLNQVGHGQHEPPQTPPHSKLNLHNPSLLNHHTNTNLYNPDLLNHRKLLSQTTRLHLQSSFQLTTRTFLLLFLS